MRTFQPTAFGVMTANSRVREARSVRDVARFYLRSAFDIEPRLRYTEVAKEPSYVGLYLEQGKRDRIDPTACYPLSNQPG